MKTKIVKNEKFECKYLDWDSNYFNLECCRVSLFADIVDDEQDAIIEYCKDFNFTTISNINNSSNNNLWLGRRTNSFLTDVNIQFFRKVRPDVAEMHPNIRLISGLPYNAEILNISKKCYNFSRFFNDEFLPQPQAQNIYHKWTMSAFDNENKHFVVYEKDEKVCGYILFSIQHNCSVIELIGVDGDYQGMGVGRVLIQALESYSMATGIEKIQVGTQVENKQAMNFYYSVGFSYLGCNSIYHLWK